MQFDKVLYLLENKTDVFELNILDNDMLLEVEEELNIQLYKAMDLFVPRI